MEKNEGSWFTEFGDDQPKWTLSREIDDDEGYRRKINADEQYTRHRHPVRSLPPPPFPFTSSVGLLGPPVSMEDGNRYAEELKSSQGFDITTFAGMSGGCYITPVILPPRQFKPSSSFFETAQRAVDLHNLNEEDEEDTSGDKILFDIIGIDRTKVKLKHQCGPVDLVEPVKMNMDGLWYLFITLRCKDRADGEIKTYQSIIKKIPAPDAYRLKLFRLKPLR